MSCKPWLQFEDATYKWGETAIFNKLSLSITEKHRVWLTGASGAGKSTFLRIIAGHYNLNCGQCFFLDQLVEKPSPKRTIVLQNYKLFPWMTVEQNLISGLKFMGIDKKENIEKAYSLLERAFLTEYKSFLPYQLSGGMCQRLSILRAIVINPSCLLLDEPFSALDEENTSIIMEIIDDYLIKESAYCIIASHNLKYAKTNKEDIFLLQSNGIINRIKNNNLLQGSIS